MRMLRVASIGVAAWAIAGTVVGAALRLAVGKWSDGLAVSGLLLVLGGLGWALGPFKTPMVWSEGGLVSYQGNAEAGPGSVRRGRWRALAVPVFAFSAGVLLLGIAAATATG